MESAIFLFIWCVLTLFRVNPAQSCNQPYFFIRSACFDQSSGQPRVNPGKQGGGAQKLETSASFLFEVSFLQPTMAASAEWRSQSAWVSNVRTPRPCSVCGSPRLCQRRERRLIGARFGRWHEERFGRARCLTVRYSLLLSVWVDPSAEHCVDVKKRAVLIHLPLLDEGAGRRIYRGDFRYLGSRNFSGLGVSQIWGKG